VLTLGLLEGIKIEEATAYARRRLGLCRGNSKLAAAPGCTQDVSAGHVAERVNQNLLRGTRRQRSARGISSRVAASGCDASSSRLERRALNRRGFWRGRDTSGDPADVALEITALEAMHRDRMIGGLSARFENLDRPIGPL